MIVVRPSSDDPVPNAAQSHVADLSDAVSRMRIRDEAAAASPPDDDLGNVVTFPRARRASTIPAPGISVSASDRFFGALGSNRGRLAAFLVCSMAAHAALYLPFMREPEPMASIGEIAITAEIVLGANMPAGNAAQTGEAEVSAPTPAQDPDPLPEAKPEPEVAQAELAKPEPEVAKAEPQQPEPQPPEQPVAETPPPPEPQQVETPEPQPQQTAALPLPEEPEPQPPVKPIATPQPPKPRKPAAKPEKPKPVERRVASHGERNDSRSTAPASSTASGVGRGRSDLNTNYRGLVAAHLARFKQFPADARGRGDTGSATVAFSLSGGGGVTSVRLVHGTGVGSLDQEATAMVRRASPFPAPPDGRSISFTVPVSFRIR
jgi:periplasmic protein TonB